MPATQDINGKSGNPSREQLLAYLSDALKLVDELNLSPEIGARLQEVIGAIEQSRG
jgi:hypothetical protein